MNKIDFADWIETLEGACKDGIGLFIGADDTDELLRIIRLARPAEQAEDALGFCVMKLSEASQYIGYDDGPIKDYATKRFLVDARAALAALKEARECA